jgi:hypothetical protein
MNERSEVVVDGLLDVQIRFLIVLLHELRFQLACHAPASQVSALTLLADMSRPHQWSPELSRRPTPRFS